MASWTTTELRVDKNRKMYVNKDNLPFNLNLSLTKISDQTNHLICLESLAYTVIQALKDDGFWGEKKQE